ncbi:unnamed protein product [Amoebophrya sp. A120]|nr:unnamed protein product [Amoebophrya sp. A120]|eukprot:GSA120T00023418001.1
MNNYPHTSSASSHDTSEESSCSSSTSASASTRGQGTASSNGGTNLKKGALVDNHINLSAGGTRGGPPGNGGNNANNPINIPGAGPGPGTSTTSASTTISGNNTHLLPGNGTSATTTNGNINSNGAQSPPVDILQSLKFNIKTSSSMLLERGISQNQQGGSTHGGGSQASNNFNKYSSNISEAPSTISCSTSTAQLLQDVGGASPSAGSYQHLQGTTTTGAVSSSSTASLVDPMARAKEKPPPGDRAPVRATRVQLTKGHRPVVAHEIPLYVALQDISRPGEAKTIPFEDKTGKEREGLVSYIWSRGPRIKSCYFHPHKMGRFQAIEKNYQTYCSKECLIKGWSCRSALATSDIRALGLAECAEPSDFWAHVVYSKGTWEVVGTEKKYIPTLRDVGHPLRLDVVPWRPEGEEQPGESKSIITGTVLDKPHEARTRSMMTAYSMDGAWLHQQFKLMNWNILADQYCNEAQYPYAEPWVLAWDYRKHLILQEIRSIAADIVTLQEVEQDIFETWLRDEMAADGYAGVYQAKKREPIFVRGRYCVEGCATFWKKSRFECCGHEICDFDEETNAWFAHNPVQFRSYEGSMQRLSKGNIALFVTLEDKRIRATKEQFRGPNGGHQLVVCNTHIVAAAESTDVKMLQSCILLEYLRKYQGVPHLVCGDFNSTPESAVYEMWSRGQVPDLEHPDIKASDKHKLVETLARSRGLNHSMKLLSGYEAVDKKEPLYTNYTENFKGTLDYVWFSAELLAVLAISKVDEEEALLEEAALPSSTRPSDHIALVVSVLFATEDTTRIREMRHEQIRMVSENRAKALAAKKLNAHAASFVPRSNLLEPTLTHPPMTAPMPPPTNHSSHPHIGNPNNPNGAHGAQVNSAPSGPPLGSSQQPPGGGPQLVPGQPGSLGNPQNNNPGGGPPGGRSNNLPQTRVQPPPLFQPMMRDQQPWHTGRAEIRTTTAPPPLSTLQRTGRLGPHSDLVGGPGPPPKQDEPPGPPGPPREHEMPHQRVDLMEQFLRQNGEKRKKRSKESKAAGGPPGPGPPGVDNTTGSLLDGSQLKPPNNTGSDQPGAPPPWPPPESGVSGQGPSGPSSAASGGQRRPMVLQRPNKQDLLQGLLPPPLNKEQKAPHLSSSSSANTFDTPGGTTFLMQLAHNRGSNGPPGSSGNNNHGPPGGGPPNSGGPQGQNQSHMSQIPQLMAQQHAASNSMPPQQPIGGPHGGGRGRVESATTLSAKHQLSFAAQQLGRSNQEYRSTTFISCVRTGHDDDPYHDLQDEQHQDGVKDTILVAPSPLLSSVHNNVDAAVEMNLQASGTITTSASSTGVNVNHVGPPCCSTASALDGDKHRSLSTQNDAMMKAFTPATTTTRSRPPSSPPRSSCSSSIFKNDHLPAAGLDGLIALTESKEKDIKESPGSNTRSWCDKMKNSSSLLTSEQPEVLNSANMLDSSCKINAKNAGEALNVDKCSTRRTNNNRKKSISSFMHRNREIAAKALENVYKRRRVSSTALLLGGGHQEEHEQQAAPSRDVEIVPKDVVKTPPGAATAPNKGISILGLLRQDGAGDDLHENTCSTSTTHNCGMTKSCRWKLWKQQKNEIIASANKKSSTTKDSERIKHAGEQPADALCLLPLGVAGPSYPQELGPRLHGENQNSKSFLPERKTTTTTPTTDGGREKASSGHSISPPGGGGAEVVEEQRRQGRDSPFQQRPAEDQFSFMHPSSSTAGRRAPSGCSTNTFHPETMAGSSGCAKTTRTGDGANSTMYDSLGPHDNVNMTGSSTSMMAQLPMAMPPPAWNMLFHAPSYTTSTQNFFFDPSSCPSGSCGGSFVGVNIEDSRSAPPSQAFFSPSCGEQTGAVYSNQNIMISSTQDQNGNREHDLPYQHYNAETFTTDGNNYNYNPFFTTTPSMALYPSGIQFNNWLYYNNARRGRS